MNKTIQQRVAELAATLKPIKDYTGAAYITCDMVEEAEDYNSYNASFYCNGWVKPVYEGDFKGAMLCKAGEFQVLRQYYVCTRLEGLAYDEIPEEWDENDGEPDYPEMKITDVVEYRQIWFNQSEQLTIDLADIYDFRDETFCTYLCDVQDWIFEPKHRQFILDTINEHRDYCDGRNLTYILSPCGELLAKQAPEFNQFIQERHRTDDAISLYRTFKVALRHKFQFPTNAEECRMYLDYLLMLSRTGNAGNMTNPKFICPADIALAHDALVAKRDKIKREEELRKARLAEPEFAEKHAWLLGIEFETEHFHFQSLDSVEAYLNEGEIMHHCIFKSEYYKKHDYLSMHIQDFEGNRVATCTVDLLHRTIEQIQPVGNATGYMKNYGINWHDTNDYKHIYNTLMARMHTFPKRKPQQTIKIKCA